jgi:hypothetical protein
MANFAAADVPGQEFLRPFVTDDVPGHGCIIREEGFGRRDL